MSLRIAIIVIVAISLIAAQNPDDAKCGVCQKGNDAYCVSETTYYNCLGGETYGDEIECPAGQVCSTDIDICVEREAIVGDVKNVCGDNSGGCSICSPGQKFTCVSKTQAARCINGEVSAVAQCKPNEICVADIQNAKSVCVPQCVADFLELTATCGTGGPFTTSTAAPPTTLPAEDRITICKNAASDQGSALFFYTYADESCRNAVYCQRNNPNSNDWVTLYRPCPSATPYFDTRIKECVAKKPESCLKLSTTPRTSTTTNNPDTTL